MDAMTLRRWRAPARDAAIAAFTGLVAMVGSGKVAVFQPTRRPVDALGYAVIAVTAAALLARRGRPVLTFVAVTTLTAAYLLLRYPYGPFFLALAVATITIASETSLRRSMAYVGAAMLGTLAAGVAGSALGPQGLELGVIGWPLWLILPWSAGLALRLTRQAADQAEREQRRRREYDQRMGIAREVHDVVGHGLAVINMQAAIALHVLERRPETARPALEAIKKASKDALEDLRGTLAVFREPGEAERVPAPGLDRLEDLVGSVGGDRLPVRLRVVGDRTAPPPAVQRAAYRIVQESLTNVLRHSGAGAATVSVHADERELRVEVADDGPGRPERQAGAGGLGLAGMRERAAALGGVLEAGPRPTGGFLVTATLPFRPGEPGAEPAPPGGAGDGNRLAER
jgi:signal transduction histidine kinase